VTHFNEDDLTLYFYGEGRRRDAVERHLHECAECSALYQEIADTLAMVATPETPVRGDEYGAEVWTRLRPRIGRFERFERFEWFKGFFGFAGFSGFGIAATVAAVVVLVTVAFVAGRNWRGSSIAPTTATNLSNPSILSNPPNPPNPENRVLLSSVADHLDRSARVLSDIMNASGRADISVEQRWAGDLLDTSRLYRQDALDAGEQSVASVLDDLERSLLEIVHTPSRASAADLEQIRRRIDAAALLFKVRVMSDELRQREQPQERSTPRPSTSKVS
jgi:hypothetical protein